MQFEKKYMKPFQMHHVLSINLKPTYFMKNVLKYPLAILGLTSSLVFSGCNQEEILLETPVQSETTDVKAALDERGVPGFNLFHPTRGVNASVQNDRYFSRSGSTHRFFLPKGTLNKKVSRPHARMEASQTSGRFGQGKWHSFEANYNVSNTLPGQVTVTQMFAVGKGPQIRIEVRSDGTLKAGFGDGKSPATLARRGEFNRSNFKLKISTDGRVADIYLNGRKKVSRRRVKHSSNSNQFRWGLYYNYKTPADVRATLSNINFE